MSLFAEAHNIAKEAAWKIQGGSIRACILEEAAKGNCELIITHELLDGTIAYLVDEGMEVNSNFIVTDNKEQEHVSSTIRWITIHQPPQVLVDGK